MPTRSELLQALVQWSEPVPTVLRDLTKFPWDPPSGLAPTVLNAQHLISATERYLVGEVPAWQLQEWAEAIECREDIEIEDGVSKQISALLFRLSNPDLEGPITPEAIRDLLKPLRISSAP